MNTETKLKVTEIQRFCMHDGPGVRTTVFLKGCPLSCAWCHNPETQKAGTEILFYAAKCIGCGSCESVCSKNAHRISENHSFVRESCVLCGACVDACPTGALARCGDEMSIDEILSVVGKDLAFYGDLGGVTLSGGEPFMQKEATLALLKACKARGLSTAVETCGFADPEILRAAVPYVDLFLWDIKDTDSARHKLYTGVANERILSNLSAVDALGARIRLRCILVNGVNTDDAHYRAAAKLAQELHNCDGVEWIPYHAYGGTKAVFLGGEDNGREAWIPPARELSRARGM